MVFVTIPVQKDQVPVSVVDAAVRYAAALLHSGGVIALPTDTVYGFACLAANKQALQRLFDIKERKKDKPIALCLGSRQEIARYGRVDMMAPFNHLLPGPVTFLLEALPYSHQVGISQTNLVGIRMPDHPFIMQVAQLCNGAIALTSANKSNEGSCLAVKEFKQLWPLLDAVFDGGTLGAIDPMRLGSTIIDLSGKEGKIVRQGCALDHVKKYRPYDHFFVQLI